MEHFTVVEVPDMKTLTCTQQTFGKNCHNNKKQKNKTKQKKANARLTLTEMKHKKKTGGNFH